MPQALTTNVATDLREKGFPVFSNHRHNTLITRQLLLFHYAKTQLTVILMLHVTQRQLHFLKKALKHYENKY